MLIDKLPFARAQVHSFRGFRGAVPPLLRDLHPLVFGYPASATGSDADLPSIQPNSAAAGVTSTLGLTRIELIRMLSNHNQAATQCKIRSNRFQISTCRRGVPLERLYCGGANKLEAHVNRDISCFNRLLCPLQFGFSKEFRQFSQMMHRHGQPEVRLQYTGYHTFP